MLFLSANFTQRVNLYYKTSFLEVYVIYIYHKLLYLHYIYNINHYFMAKFTKANWMTRKLQDKLTIVGEQFRLARLRRNLTMELVAQRAQCSRQTLERLEKGSPQVSLGVVLRVLNALQLDDDILSLAKDDILGHIVQDMELKNKKRASKK